MFRPQHGMMLADKTGMFKLALLFLVLPLVHAMGQGPDDSGEDSSDVLIRINAPVTIPAGDSVGTAIVINDNVIADGTVKNNLIVINDTATVSGTVLQDVIVIKGHLILTDGARVGRDVMLLRSTISRAPGATVGGAVETRQRFFPGAAVGWFFWLATLVVASAFGALLVTFASRQLAEASLIFTQHTSKAVITGLIVMFGLPAVAIACFFTFIGIPLGFAIFFMIIPALWIAGYIVAGITTGAALLTRLNKPARQRPYLAVILGIITLHVMWAIPFIGGLLTMIVSWLGAGALTYRIWRARQTGQ